MILVYDVGYRLRNDETVIRCRAKFRAPTDGISRNLLDIGATHTRLHRLKTIIDVLNTERF